MKEDYSFHHIGILTQDLENARDLYVTKFNYKIEFPAIQIGSLGISACSLTGNGAPRVELIEPVDQDSPLGKRARQGTGGYHLAWTVPSLEAASSQLEGQGFHGMNVFISPLWSDARCRFLVGADNLLVELIQQP